MLKIPETVIKALHQDAPACLGLTVNDEPRHPFTLTMPNSSPQDAVLLRNILNSGYATLHYIARVDDAGRLCPETGPSDFAAPYGRMPAIQPRPTEIFDSATECCTSLIETSLPRPIERAIIRA